MYLTPERAKTMGLGVDLSEVETVAIRSAIARASAVVDAACSVPRQPQRHDFRGGIITGERHDWVIDPYGRPRANRVFPFHTPIVSVERLRIFSDNVNFVEIDVGGVVINNSGGYIEVSSLLLTQYGVFGAGIVPYIGLFHPISEIDYTYRYEFVVVDEVAEPVDARTYQTQHQFWIPNTTVTVKVDGTTKTVTTDYTLNRREGTVIFVVNQLADAEVTVSYSHSLPYEISQATAILLAQDLGESDLRAKGMQGLASIKVKDVTLTRERGRQGGGQVDATMDNLPGEVRQLLSGYNFVTAR
jgi:hypothetical protein